MKASQWDTQIFRGKAQRFLNRVKARTMARWGNTRLCLGLAEGKVRDTHTTGNVLNQASGRDIYHQLTIVCVCVRVCMVLNYF